MEATWRIGGSNAWEEESRQRLRMALAISFTAHVITFGLMTLSPRPAPFVLPAAIQVHLVAAPPSVAPPAPKAPISPPPPPPPQVKILPKEAPPAVTRPKPSEAAPQEVRRPRPQEMDLSDAMASLRSDLGETAPSQAQTQAEPSTGQVTVAPELQAWMLATKRHVQSIWVNPAEFLGRGLLTELRVELRADGSLVGRPEVVHSSGDPYADDNAVRALLKANPLPPPPAAGPQIFIFSPESRS